MSDHLTELEFTVAEFSTAAGMEMEIDGSIAFERAVPIGDGDFLEYGTADASAIDALEALADGLPHAESLTILEQLGGTVQFELHLSDPPVLSSVASHGGYVDRAEIEQDTLQLRIHLSPTVDARRVIATVHETYPTATLVARRQISSGDDTRPTVHEAVTENLTDRQQATLEAAYYAGFFEWPRTTTGEEVAESLGIAPATFSQHLRLGQQRVFTSLFGRDSSA